MRRCAPVGDVFFFNDTATTEIYTLSLHDALPISARLGAGAKRGGVCPRRRLDDPRHHVHRLQLHVRLRYLCRASAVRRRTRGADLAERADTPYAGEVGTARDRE